MEAKEKTPVGFGVSVAVFVALLVLVVTLTAVFGSAPHVPLLIAAVIAAVIGGIHRYSWDEMLKGITAAVTAAVPALLII